MKRISTIVFASMVLILACQKKDNQVAPAAITPATQTTAKPNFSNLARYAGPDYSQAIPKDSANRMIQSYLTSVGYPGVDESLRSLSFDADSLLNYLSDPSHDKIATVKFMFAHTPSYINSGKYGQYAGMNPNALTLVIVGLNESNEYVFSRNMSVFEHLRPCPSSCDNVSPTL